MPTMRTTLLVAIGTLTLAAGMAHAGPQDLGEPYIPRSAGVVLQHVPPSTDPRVRQFEQLRSELEAHPHDATRAVALARAYIGYGRSTGDARYLGRALAVIQPWLRQSEPPIPVQMVHATIQQSRHFFKKSRALLKHILARDPGNLQAWLTLATVAMVQGDMDAANKACVRVAAVGGRLMGVACTAALRSLTGQAAQAYALFSLIDHPGAEVPAGVKAWLQGLMADTAVRLGKPAAAEKHFKRALQLTPGDNFLLAAYGDFLLAQGRPRDVIALVGNYRASDTSFLRLVYAEAALDLPKAEADAAEMAARFAAMDRRGSHVYRREQAGFVLHVQHDPERALQLAIKNLEVQRAPKDVRIYLEAALAAQQPQAAAPVLAFIDRTGLRSVKIDPLVHKVRARLSAATRRESPAATATGDAP